MLQGYNIAEAIKAAKRERRGKKDAQKAINGITRQRLSRILKGESKATIKELEDICEAFGLQLMAVKSEQLAKMQRFEAFLRDLLRFYFLRPLRHSLTTRIVFERLQRHRACLHLTSPPRCHYRLRIQSSLEQLDQATYAANLSSSFFKLLNE